MSLGRAEDGSCITVSQSTVTMTTQSTVTQTEATSVESTESTLSTESTTTSTESTLSTESTTTTVSSSETLSTESTQTTPCPYGIHSDILTLTLYNILVYNMLQLQPHISNICFVPMHSGNLFGNKQHYATTQGYSI